MPGYTVSAAARLCGVDRRTLQRAMASGRLARTASGQLTLEALQQAGYAAPTPQVAPQDAAGMPQGMRLMPHLVPQDAAPTPQDMPQELALATTLLAHLEEIARTMTALHQEVVSLREDLRQTPPRRPRIPWGTPQADAAPLPQHATLTPQETPQGVRHAAAAPQGDAAPLPHDAAAAPQGDAAAAPHHDALLPQGMPQDAAGAPQGDAAPLPQDMRHATGAPHHNPATPESPTTLPAHVQRIAEVAAEYNRLTLVDLSQLLYDRDIYRARDRKTGREKPVNKGTLQHWLAQARQAGIL